MGNINIVRKIQNTAMIVDDSAAIFLNNYLVKNKRKLNEVNNELSRKLQEVAKLKEKMTDFAQGQKYGAYDDVNEVRSRQAISLLQTDMDHLCKEGGFP